MPLPVWVQGCSVFAAVLVFATGDPLSERPPDHVYDSLWLYKGTWISTSMPDHKRDVIANDCARVGRYFACQQTVNGDLSGLIIFLSRKQSGHFIT